MSTPRVRPVFVVFEGLDGTGKSTCARRTADALGAEYLTTPSLRLRAHRDAIVVDFDGSQEAAQLFYLATVFSASREVKRLLASGSSVVLDRYFLSTQAYAAFRGSTIGLDELAGSLLCPHLTVLLEAPLDVRRARVTDRGATMADRETMQAAADAGLRFEHDRRLGLPVIGRLLRCDTSVETPDDVAARVVAALP